MTSVTHAVRDVGLMVAARLTPRATADGDTVLVAQPDHLGDILLSQPAVRLLREQLPHVRLVGVVGPWSAEIARLAWPVDDVVAIDFPGFARATSSDPSAPYRLLRPASETLARLRPGAAIVLRPDAWWAAWLGALVAREVVTASDTRTRRFATLDVPVSDDEHAAVRAARIVAGWVGGALPSPDATPVSIRPDASARGEAAALLSTAAVDRRYAVVHPGSGAAVKLWPESHWRQVIGALSERGLAVVVTGGNGEQDLCASITSGTGAVNIAGRTTVAVLLEVMRGAAITAGTDNGPMHLAVAAGTPTVHVFGPSDPRRYGPWGDARRHRVVSAGWRCLRCGDLGPDRPAGCGCMLAITSEVVVAAIDDLLDAHDPG
ncbi:MAG TPA: glycosyltransferase family 9 protein [Thermomicrobiales bacterium]|nr:glycosyltransferase family 9 protein [Thermomicrobiales bacterium]